METKPSTHLDVSVSDHWMVVSRGHFGAEVKVQLQQDGEVQEHRVHCHAYVILKVTFDFFNLYAMGRLESFFHIKVSYT